MNKYRTHLLKDINETLAGQDVVVSGWVENIRDHGGVLFLEMKLQLYKLCQMMMICLKVLLKNQL